MPDPAGTKNDGGMVFGSQVLQIANTASQATDYIAEQFSIDTPANWLESKNEFGVPNKQVGIIGIRTGSATLQLEDSTTKPPAMFAEFDAVEIGGDTVTLLVAKVGQAFTQDGETKLTIDLREKLAD